MQPSNPPPPTSSIDQRIVASLRSVLSEGIHSLHEPCFHGNEQTYVQDCILSTFVSSVGAYVDRFEQELSTYTGAKRAIATVNGTAALQVALKLAGVQAGDEVLVPTLTFIATANAVNYLGATPHFVDSEAQTLGLDPAALRAWLEHIAEASGDGFRNRVTGSRLRAIVPMHVFGNPCDLDGLQAIARDYRLVLVEDAAESLGSFYHDCHTGTFGKLGTLSFNGNKIITTGGGGAILTNDDDLADQAKHLTTTAKRPHRWEYLHDDIGYNYRMPNLNAALGCAQLEQLPMFLDSKRRLTDRYQEAFGKLIESGTVRLLREPTGCFSNYWLQAIILEERHEHKLESILISTNDAGLMTRPSWSLMHQLPPYQGCPHAPLPVAESLARRIINLPSSAGLV